MTSELSEREAELARACLAAVREILPREAAAKQIIAASIVYRHVRPLREASDSPNGNSCMDAGTEAPRANRLPA